MDSKNSLLGSDGANEENEYGQLPAFNSRQSVLITRLTRALCLSGALSLILGLQCLYLICREPIREGTLYGKTSTISIRVSRLMEIKLASPETSRSLGRYTQDPLMEIILPQWIKNGMGFMSMI